MNTTTINNTTSNNLLSNFSKNGFTNDIKMPESFSDISYDLLMSVMNNLDRSLMNEFCKCVINSGHVDLVITGNIGVGKSTCCQLLTLLLKDKLQINTYPEYIRMEKCGEEMLKLRADKKISVETFQHFILDFWYLILHDRDYNSKHLSIYERLPEDSLYCFAKQSYECGDIQPDGWKRLVNRYEEIKTDFNIFEKKDCVVVRISNESSLDKTLHSIMMTVIELLSEPKPTKKIYVILDVDRETYHNRIHIRNRDSEKALSSDILRQYESYY